MTSRMNLLAALGLIARGSLVAASVCDAYAVGKTPCVAAHSTTRALYDNYNGALYQVKRGSDNTTKNVPPLGPGRTANAAVQDQFCAGTTCLITIIYDQSGHNNHLTQAGPGGQNGANAGPAAGGYDNLAPATGAPILINGTKAYGVFIQPGTGYRQDKTSGVATYDQPEGIYAVLDGTHYASGGGCCFDYGNVEVGANTDNGPGHMETIFFGGKTAFNGGYGTGDGPWIMSDQENGIFSGTNFGYNAGDPTINYRFVTAIVKGQSNNWAIRGGNAVSGGLSTFFNGARNGGGYNPMSKEGGIVLGVGGDNTHGGEGTFYEGALTSGFPSDNVEAYVQANIVNMQYKTTSQTSGAAVTPGSSVSIRATTAGGSKSKGRRASAASYISHRGSAVTLQQVTSSSRTSLKQQASWNVHPGLGNSGCVSFESKHTPGSYLRHSDSKLLVSVDDGTEQMHKDATFCPQAGLVQGNTIQSWNYPTKYIRHYDGALYIASHGNSGNAHDTHIRFHDDVSFVVGESFS